MNQTPAPKFELNGSRQLTSWMHEHHVSLGFSTYQTGKLFLIGLQPNGKLSVFERTFERCMGLTVHGNSLYMSTLYQIWRLENALAEGEAHQGYDRLYVPQVGYTTGDVDVHDMAVTESGQLVFVNTLFGCLATLSDTHNFKPLWKPPFISRLAAEDRCHLNGLALKDGEPRYVTAIGRSDIADGWRDQRKNGGVVMDITNDAVIAEGLSMPHSPRFYRDKIWLHDSGTGYFGHVEGGKFEPLVFCPGYLRGLAFVGDFAIAGISCARKNKTFSGLALEDNLQAKGAEARCGILVIDLRNGDIAHWLRIEGMVDEIYDVIALPGVRRPMLLGFKGEEIRRMITMETAG